MFFDHPVFPQIFRVPRSAFYLYLGGIWQFLAKSFNFLLQKYVAVFLFAGDISLDKPIRQGNGSACPYEQILSDVTKYFLGVDYNMINLEAPFVDEKLAEKSFLEDKGKYMDV